MTYDKEYFKKRFMDGATAKELSKEFGISTSTVHSRLSRLKLNYGLKNKVDPKTINFKVLSEYPNYGILEDGSVFNIKRGNIISTTETRDGYITVKVVNKDKKRCNKRVHRLVASAYLPNFENNKTEVNHKDFDTRNNSVDNLEWVTPSENMSYSLYNGRGTGRYDIQIIEDICKNISKGLSNTENAKIISKNYKKEYRSIIKVIENIKYSGQWNKIYSKYKK